MIPTGSWPMVSPRATGYSPFRICTSVPQMVVVVMRSNASSGPTCGIGFSSSTMRPASTKIAAFIRRAMQPSCRCGHHGTPPGPRIDRDKLPFLVTGAQLALMALMQTALLLRRR